MTALADFLSGCTELARVAQPIARQGRLAKVTGMVVEAGGLELPVGSLCRFRPAGGPAVEAEVVGFNGGRLLLMPSSDTAGLAQSTVVEPHEPAVQRPRLGRATHPWRRLSDRMRHLPIGDGLLGRVIDADGVPLDGLGELQATDPAPIYGRRINAMDREPIKHPLDTGVRAINSLLTVGRGQRLGLFAGAGVGKSVLLGMMARYTGADVIVVGLVGERGREIKEFVEEILGDDGRRRSVVVAAPSDTPPIARLQGANYATAIAEHFRDQGRHVLLLMDSLTRYAMAAREVALAIGEAPATKGYPPSVFARLPALIERTGNGIKGNGSITAFYTVLAEGDDQQDPIADSARSFLDGHIVLTRGLADAGHYPAIDVEQSISRVMTAITPMDHQLAARRLKALWSRYQRSRELITIGAYAPGSDAQTDLAIQLMPQIEQFLRQETHDRCSLADARTALERLVGADPKPAPAGNAGAAGRKPAPQPAAKAGVRAEPMKQKA